MKRSRILYVANTSKGGSAFSLFHMMQGLDKSRFEPSVAFHAREESFVEQRLQKAGARVFFLSDGNGAAGSTGSEAEPGARDIGRWLASRIGKSAGDAYHLVRGLQRYLRYDLPHVATLARIIREQEIDLVHANNSLRSAKPAIAAAKRAGIPCLSHVRGFTNLKSHDLVFARRVDLFVYISRAIGQHYQRQGVSTAGVVVHNVVDLSEFPAELADPERARELRQEFGWAEGTPVVGLVGRLDWWKGHETFLQAIANLSDRVPNLRALIIGDPVETPAGRRYHQKLQAMTQSLQLENTVVFTGFRSEIPRLMASMDIIVLASSEPEPFGRVVIEGMAAGKPVVATAAGGVLDIIQDHENGRLVASGDADAMADAIADLALHPQEARKMGSAARQRVETSFTLPRQIETIQTVYDTILSTPKPQRAQIRWQDLIDAPELRPLPS